MRYIALATFVVAAALLVWPSVLWCGQRIAQLLRRESEFSKHVEKERSELASAALKKAVQDELSKEDTN